MEHEMKIPDVQDLLDLSGKVVIITGSGSGLGRGIARRFSQAGAAVVVNYFQSASGAETLVQQISQDGGQATAVQADVSQGEDVERLIRNTVDTFGKLDVMVNNAGIYPSSTLVEMTAQEWDRVMDINMRSVFLGTQAAARQMIAQGQGGAIINVASIEGENPAPMHSHYNASKAGVIMHTRSAAQELGKDGIRVNTVSPGLIWAKGIEQSWPDGVQRWKKKAPLTRLGQPEDVADACIFLASPAARWITGAELRVDGGVMTSQIF
jgi:NAD(P)-dependent dehydrogenase (short-subunit alcohol dehydrogenase family)